MRDIEDIQRDCDAATPGPWHPDAAAVYVFADPIEEGFMICQIRGWGHLTGCGHMALKLSDEEAYAVQAANQRFIANAREDVPSLLDEVKRLRGVVDGLLDECAETVTPCRSCYYAIDGHSAECRWCGIAHPECNETCTWYLMICDQCVHGDCSELKTGRSNWKRRRLAAGTQEE